MWALVHDRRLLAEVEGVCTTLAASVSAIEAGLDDAPTATTPQATAAEGGA